ncbi:MAG: TIGR03620 family F420-dependent LLM class oxidoreductase [Sphingobium sp.]
MAKTDIGRIGIWSMEARFGDPAQAADAVAELDELGYGALWVPGGMGGDLTGDLDRLLAASSRITIASGILNIWKHDAADVANWWKALPEDHRSRVLLGLGVSHSHIVGDDYAKQKPLAAMRAYLDALNAEDMPGEALCLAALGPKMLLLARDRTAGVHPYLVTPEHSAIARRAVGPDRLVAPEQGVVLETDPDKARALARTALDHYRGYPNYRNSWTRLGFSKAEIDAMSDRLVDALFAWGDMAAIAARVNAHLEAGADHVCIQVITGAGTNVEAARPAWRELAAALL